MFITDSDYEVQAKQEILSLLDPSLQHTGVSKAEKFAMSEITKRIGGRYDMKQVFAQRGEDRDFFIVMITIDIAIYHLYSQKAARKIPEYRETRYRDAIEWLTSVGEGLTPTDLPPIELGEDNKGEVRIFSLYAPNNNKF